MRQGDGVELPTAPTGTQAPPLDRAQAALPRRLPAPGRTRSQHTNARTLPLSSTNQNFDAGFNGPIADHS